MIPTKLLNCTRNYSDISNEREFFFFFCKNDNFLKDSQLIENFDNYLWNDEIIYEIIEFSHKNGMWRGFAWNAIHLKVLHLNNKRIFLPKHHFRTSFVQIETCAAIEMVCSIVVVIRSRTPETQSPPPLHPPTQILLQFNFVSILTFSSISSFSRHILFVSHCLLYCFGHIVTFAGNLSIHLLTEMCNSLRKQLIELKIALLHRHFDTYMRLNKLRARKKKQTCKDLK